MHVSPPSRMGGPCSCGPASTGQMFLEGVDPWLLLTVQAQRRRRGPLSVAVAAGEHLPDAVSSVFSDGREQGGRHVPGGPQPGHGQGQARPGSLPEPLTAPLG